MNWNTRDLLTGKFKPLVFHDNILREDIHASWQRNYRIGRMPSPRDCQEDPEEAAEAYIQC